MTLGNQLSPPPPPEACDYGVSKKQTLCAKPLRFRTICYSSQSDQYTTIATSCVTNSSASSLSAISMFLLFSLVLFSAPFLSYQNSNNFPPPLSSSPRDPHPLACTSLYTPSAPLSLPSSTVLSQQNHTGVKSTSSPAASECGHTEQNYLS